MRIRCALIAIAVLAGAAHAQFPQGWEPGPAVPGVGPIPSGWTTVNNSPGGPGLNPNWQVRNEATPAVFPPHMGATYAFANYNSSTGANDISNYLISPLLTFNNGDTISFWTRTVSGPAYPDRLALVYNTTGSVLPADFTNTLLTVNPSLTLTGYPTFWTQFTGTIAGLGGPTSGRFAFHYNPTGGGPAGANSDYIGVDEVEFVSATTPTVDFCDGSVTGACLACGNLGAPGNGCANQSFPAGAHLAASGVAGASIATDTLVLTATNIPGPGLFFQSNGINSINPFGDGMLCASVSIIRMGVVFPGPPSPANTAAYPGGSTPAPIHIAGGPIASGDLKHYQCWYRDAAAFCSPSTFNLTQGISLTWGP